MIKYYVIKKISSANQANTIVILSLYLDVGQGYNGPKTGDQGQKIEPWTHNKIVLQGQVFEPWTYQKFVHAIAHTIAHKIVCTIVRTSVRTKTYMECMNEFHVERVCWMMDNGQTNQKMDVGQTI